MKKRIIPFLLSLFVLINLPVTLLHASATVMTPFERELVAAVGVDAITRMEAQKDAVDAYSALCEHYRNAAGEVVFPEDYGGEYIIDNVLHIYLTDLSKTTLLRYAEILAGYEDAVTFEKVDYSYNELAELRSEAEAVLGSAVRGSYVDTRTNSVVIQTAPETVAAATAAISGAKSLPAGPVVIEKAAAAETQATQIRGGDVLTKLSGGSRTLAICGTYNGEPAVLTCGHGTSSAQYFGINGSGAAVQALYIQFANNQAGDYSICGVIDPTLYETTDQVIYYNNTYIPVDGVHQNISRGMYLIKYGKTTQFTTVQVTDNDFTLEVGAGVYITDLIYTGIVTGNSKGGDSGGPYFTYTDGECTFAGVHSSGMPTYGDTEGTNKIATHTAFTPYNVVTEDFVVNLAP